MKKITAQILAIALLLLAFTACAGKGDSEGQPTSPPTPTQAPKVYLQNPLTGLEKSSDYPKEKSSVAVMVNNIMSNGRENAWPQAGLSDADIVYEMETEGGITRYMALYSDYQNMPTVGPVRSARDQFVQLMIPTQSLYVHVGGSSYAKDMLNLYGWQDRDIDGYSKPITWLDEERAKTRSKEHCSFTNGKNITQAVQKFNMSDENKDRNIFNWVKYDMPDRVPDSEDVNAMYWRFSPLYDTFFTYHPETKTYTKEHQYIPQDYKKPLIDTNYGEKPVEFDNVFVLWTQIERYPDKNMASGKSVLSKVDMDFGGIGYYFTNGKYEKVRWQKGAPTDWLKITDAQGNEKAIEVNTGKSYVAFVDLDYFGTFKINDRVLDEAGDYTPSEKIPVEGENQEAQD
ncbi:MAG: DUF3048 domain-containing protein [Oscillospiraceae bacterium]